MCNSLKKAGRDIFLFKIICNTLIFVYRFPILDSKITIMATSHIIAEPGNISQTQQQIRDTINKRKLAKSSISEKERLLQSLEEAYHKKQSSILKLFTKKEVIDNLWNDINIYKNEISAMYQELEALTVNIDEINRNVTESEYRELIQLFENVCKSSKIWNIKSQQKNTDTKSSAGNVVDRQEVSFSTAKHDFLDAVYPSLYFKNLNGADLYIYPSFLLQIISGEVFLTDINRLSFSFKDQQFIEPEHSVPSDSKIIDRVWERVNKDGTPDLRFKGNYQIPVVKYGILDFCMPEVMETKYYVSNYEVAENFSGQFQRLVWKKDIKHIQPVIPVTKNGFSEQYHELLSDFSKEFKKLSKNLSRDSVLREKIESLLNDSAFDEFIQFCIIYDLCQVAKILNDGFYKKEALETTGLVLISNCILPSDDGDHLSNFEYGTLALSHEKGIYKKMGQSIMEIGDRNNPLLLNDEISRPQNKLGDFSLPTALKALDHELFDEYASALYQFANIIAKADNNISTNEKERLKDIYKLAHYPLPPKETRNAIVPSGNESIEDIMAELDSLIGLEKVKHEIKTLINFIKVQKAREATGLKSSNISYHIIFTGNPGTGKTSVARIVAKIYKALGILSQGQLVETDRAGIIAEYVGQTAIKVNKVVDSALNGVLFIDEAYSLAGDSQNDYGKEAIATLLKRMEDDRNKLVVIAAGYTDEMDDFINTNPGLKSRFNRHIEFVDYSPSELLAIYESQCSKSEYSLTDDARSKLTSLFHNAYNSRNSSFGNGRYVRNIFEKSLELQANRIASIESLTKEILTTINAEDIPVNI